MQTEAKAVYGQKIKRVTAMFILWGALMGIFLWLELIYHFSGFGFTAFHPVYMIFLTACCAALCTLIIGTVKGRGKKILYYIFIWLPTLWVCAQLVYLRIFRQPLLFEMMIVGGQDALTDYWREALAGILSALPFLLLLILPSAVVPHLIVKRLGIALPQFNRIVILKAAMLSLAGGLGCAAVLLTGKQSGLDFYELYHEFYDPLTLAQEYGVFPLFQGDLSGHLRQALPSLWLEETGSEYAAANAKASAAGKTAEPSQTVETVSANTADPSRTAETVSANTAEPSKTEETVSANTAGSAQTEETLSADIQTPAESVEEPAPAPHQLDIDFDRLRELADNNKQAWLADYIQNKTPVSSNEYTGMFKDYNLIFLTAEGFCSYAIDEKLTPTLYQLAHSGFVCSNYYVPLWQTSTSDGEYINMTGLIPKGQHSMRRTAQNVQPFVLPAFFASEGVYSWAYHDNSLSYYDRYLTHPNMGYDFKACRLGKLSRSEWGDKVFEMEQPNEWPASDYNMMAATVPEYVKADRFHVYYMTVSGHMNYNFAGNAMAAKNKDAVAGLELSEKSKAYIACNIELDKAMANLLEQLEAAGQLEKTVICLSADHYPYSFTDEEYEELAGKDLSAGKDLYRNTLILWNAGIKEPITIDKACSSLDILPTLLNLFGFDYDSRMYAGNDILSDEEGMVIFNNRDFVTDGLIFIEKKDEAVWLKDAAGNDIVPDEEKEAYLAAKRQEVKDRCLFSADILEENYYSDILEALPDHAVR